MKNLVLGTISALALLGAAACSDSGTDTTTTQSTTPPAAEQPITPDAPKTEAVPTAPDASGGTTTDNQMKPAAPAQ